MGLALMAEQVGCGGERGVVASLYLAPVGLEMRIHEFAVNGVSVSIRTKGKGEEGEGGTYS